jgi:hypothetical protein
MCQDATFMLNHSITKDALSCRAWHTKTADGIVPFEALGHAPAGVRDLRELPELHTVERARAIGDKR